MSELILVESPSPAVKVVTLNRPDRRNALSVELLDLLKSTIEGLEDDSDTRVVVLRGAGAVFTSGLDLREAGDPEQTAQSADSAARAMRQVRQSPLITIAVVQGGAWAGGAALMACCDIVIAAENAKVAFPAARRGVVPSLILDLVHGRIGDGDLRDLFLTGLPADAQKAQRMGLVQRVVPEESLMQEAETVAEAIVAGGPQTIRDTKELLNRAAGAGSDSDSVFGATIEQHVQAQSDESLEGMAAFMERRKPWWSAS